MKIKMIYEVVYVNESGEKSIAVFENEEDAKSFVKTKKYSKVLLPEQNGIQESVYKLRSFYDKNKN